ncbi:MerR family transcriptional regulator [Paenibacillus puldeungensis]|uniref:MerR family transcriptional regulator n=1 Tax=Paenibacillus puldeungensis TaxID=696536 RepID=A0ABW3RX48_9BACL
MTYYSTGEVSKKLKMSLRTLRYYDQIGLVVPSVREDNGRRYYSDEDMLLLQKIALLKSTSMSLQDMKKIINQVTIDRVLSVHKEQLETNIKQLKEALQHTNTLLNILKLDGELYWDQLTPLVLDEERSRSRENAKRQWESLFNEEEISILSKQLPKLEDDQGQTIKWIDLVKRIECCLEDGKTPSSKEGQLIAEDIQLLTRETFGDHPEMVEKFWEARKSETASVALHLYPIKREVLTFIEKAIEHFEESDM